MTINSALVGDIKRTRRNNKDVPRISYLKKINSAGGLRSGRIAGPFEVKSPDTVVAKLLEHRPGAKNLIVIYEANQDGSPKKFIDAHY